jgi:hypothetical protein
MTYSQGGVPEEALMVTAFSSIPGGFYQLILLTCPVHTN